MASQVLNYSCHLNISSPIKELLFSIYLSHCWRCTLLFVIMDTQIKGREQLFYENYYFCIVSYLFSILQILENYSDQQQLI